MPRKGHPLRLFSLLAPVFLVKRRKDRCGAFRSPRYWPCCHSFPIFPFFPLALEVFAVKSNNHMYCCTGFLPSSLAPVLQLPGLLVFLSISC